MDKNLWDAILKKLISEKGYLPVKDNQGNAAVYERMAMLEKRSWDSYYILSLFDGDAMPIQEIHARLEHDYNYMESLDRNSAVTFIHIFLFDAVLPEDKLWEINAREEDRFWGRKHLVNFSVILETKQIVKQSHVQFSVDGLYDFFNKVLSMDIHSLNTGKDINEFVKEVQKEAKIKIATKKPVFSYILIALNIIIWVLVNIFGQQQLKDVGIKDNIAILNGELWRLFTPIFLHADIKYGGIAHLLLNSYSLYVLGPDAERIFGYKKFLTIYFVAGVFGNIASFIFNPNPSLGASGAIFGLLGAMLYMGQRYRRAFSGSYASSIIITIAVNLIYGFSHAGIDNFAHIGGLVGGYLSTLLFDLPGGMLKKPGN